MFTRLQSTHCFRFFFSIRSSQMRVLRPFPSRNGCATFISTYLFMISSNVVSGIRSIRASDGFRCCASANMNPPLLMFFVRICPANSYSPPKRYAWICRRHSTVPGFMVTSL